MSEDNLSEGGHVAAIDKARREGFEVLEATKFQVFVDLDSEDAIKRFEFMLTQAGDLGIQIQSVERWKSKTPGHQHAIVNLAKKASAQQRVTWAVYLGTDMKAAEHCFRRVADDEQSPIVLFRPPDPKKV